MQDFSLRSEDERDAVNAGYGPLYSGMRRASVWHGEELERYDRGLQAVRITERKVIRDTWERDTLFSFCGGSEEPIENEDCRTELAAKLRAYRGDLPTVRMK